MYIVTTTIQGIADRKFSSLRDAMNCARGLADRHPGVYRILDDNQSSFVTAATVRATFELRDESIADEYRAHYAASVKAYQPHADHSTHVHAGFCYHCQVWL